MSQLRSQLSQRETDEINQERARATAELSPEQREALNEVNRAAIAAARDNKTEEEREERRRLDAKATRAARDNETEEEREERIRLELRCGSHPGCT